MCSTLSELLGDLAQDHLIISTKLIEDLIVNKRSLYFFIITSRSNLLHYLWKSCTLRNSSEYKAEQDAKRQNEALAIEREKQRIAQEAANAKAVQAAAALAAANANTQQAKVVKE